MTRVTKRILFVHGMGRSPLSGWPMLARLRRAGLRTETFGYVAALQDFDAIVARLITRLQALAAGGDAYALIGHSLGGVLLRAALDALPSDTPRPRHLFLLGSPIGASRLAIRLQRRFLFRALAGDCGQMLGTPARMAGVAAVNGGVPTTAVVGVRGLACGPFGTEPNDGVVARSEVVAPWLSELVEIPVMHTLLPASGRVAEIVLQALR